MNWWEFGGQRSVCVTSNLPFSHEWDLSGKLLNFIVCGRTVRVTLTHQTCIYKSSINLLCCCGQTRVRKSRASMEHTNHWYSRHTASLPYFILPSLPPPLYAGWDCSGGLSRPGRDEGAVRWEGALNTPCCISNTHQRARTGQPPVLVHTYKFTSVTLW